MLFEFLVIGTSPSGGRVAKFEQPGQLNAHAGVKCVSNTVRGLRDLRTVGVSRAGLTGPPRDKLSPWVEEPRAHHGGTAMAGWPTPASCSRFIEVGVALQCLVLRRGDR